MAQRVAVPLLLDRDFLLQRRGALLQHELLAAHGQEIARADAELVMIDRAQQEIGGARLERLVAEVAILIGGDDHHRDVGAGGRRAEAADELGAVEIRHLEVGDDEIGRLIRRVVERQQRVVEGPHLDPVVERGRETLEDLEIGDPVVDDRYGLASHARFREHIPPVRQTPGGPARRDAA
jgi:hypothetical protein